MGAFRPTQGYNTLEMISWTIALIGMLIVIIGIILSWSIDLIALAGFFSAVLVIALIVRSIIRGRRH